VNAPLAAGDHLAEDHGVLLVGADLGLTGADVALVEEFLVDGLGGHQVIAAVEAKSAHKRGRRRGVRETLGCGSRAHAEGHTTRRSTLIADLIKNVPFGTKVHSCCSTT